MNFAETSAADGSTHFGSTLLVTEMTKPIAVQNTELYQDFKHYQQHLERGGQAALEYRLDFLVNQKTSYVKNRKMSGGTRSEAGRRCRDTLGSLKKTCRELGVGFWSYLRDRLSGRNTILPLSVFMGQGAAERSAEKVAAAFAG